MTIEHMFGGDCMKKNKLVKLVIVLSLLGLILLTLTPKAQGVSNTKYSKIVVYPGDTIWSIATDYIDSNTDIRKLVYEIREVNKLNSAIITPGQQLLIPLD
jgi:LysM repeat protein